MDNHAIDSYVRAGHIVSNVKSFARELVRPGMKLIDIALAIDEKIEELGGKPAFPVNLSLNEIAAHFTPTMDCEGVAEGLLKIDIGVAVDGYIADTAFTLDLTPDNRHKDMIALNKTILATIMNNVSYGDEARRVGELAQETLHTWNEKTKKEYRIIKSLSGHELGQNVIHAGMTISNYRNDSKTPLRDIAIAVEPFVTTGVGDIYEGNPGGIYVLQSLEQPRDKDARILLDYIREHYKTLPFCSRWLEKAGFSKLRYLLGLLTRQGILHQYPLLIEKSKQPVSQFENTFLFVNNKVTITSFEEGWLEKY